MSEQEIIEKLKSGEPIPEVKSVEGLRLQPGDFVVLRYEGRATLENMHRLKSQLEGLFEGKNKVIVLDQGIELKVLKSA